MKPGVFRLSCPDSFGVGLVGDERAHTVWGQFGNRHIPGNVPCTTCRATGLRPEVLTLIDRLPEAEGVIEAAASTVDYEGQTELAEAASAVASLIDALHAALTGKDQS